MIKCRKGMFETNSSSTHSICISKEKIDTDKLAGRRIHFGFGEWGWEVDTVYDTADYLYTAILGNPSADIVDQRLEKLKAILDKYHINYSFEPMIKENGRYYPKETEYYGIDHGNECCDFVDAVLDNEDMLLNWLFGDSFVETGNDNGCERDAACFCAFGEVWDNGTFVPNPRYNEDKYTYFFKGN